MRHLCLIVLLALFGTEESTVGAQVVAGSANPEFLAVSYKKLCSPTFVDDFVGKRVVFKIKLLAEFTLVDTYTVIGNPASSVDQRVFLNHRDVTYQATQLPLGLSDSEIPPFAISIEKARSDFVFDANRGDIFKIRGFVEAWKGFSSKSLHVHIIEATKVR